MPFKTSDLPFDEGEYIGRLRDWVLIESPTFDIAAVERMLDRAARDFAGLDAAVESIDGRLGFAGARRIRLSHPRAGEPGILVMAHLDTVHPVGTLAALPWRRQDGRCRGPGVLDMKGGLCLALQALVEIRRAGIATALPVTVLLTGDEEAGTPSARALVEAEARRQRYVLVPAPGRASGRLLTGRYAVARFDLRTIGRPSHAGAHLADGRSAIRAMAQRIVEIKALTSESCTFSVGLVHGGRWVDRVATACEAEVLSMAKRQEDLDRGASTLLGMAGERDGVRFEVRRGVTRPVWEPDKGTLSLYAKARALATDLGFDVDHESSAGGSDGNFTGALGVPTLDGLGAVGAGLHTLDEHIEVALTLQRGRLLAGLLATLD